MNKSNVKQFDNIPFECLENGMIKSVTENIPHKYLKFIADTNSSAKHISGWVSKPNTDRQDGSLLSTGVWFNDSIAIPYLYGHDYKNIDSLLGKLIEHRSTEEGVWINNELHDFSAYPMLAWKLVNGGFINTMSVGYNPEKWVYNESYGMDISKWEYLEGSLVPVPANPQAVVDNTRSMNDYNELQRKYSELSAAIDALKGENMDLKMSKFALMVNDGIAKAISQVTLKIKGEMK